MVLEAIEVVERRATSRVIAARASSVGVEVPLQGHGTHGETGGLGRAMQIAHRVEAPVLMVHGRSSALEVRWAPGKRYARANWAPLLQSLRTICRRAPAGRRAWAHSRRRRSLWENCARVRELETAQTRPRISVRVARSRPQRLASFTTEWRKHRRMPTVGKRRLQALCVPSQPSVHTVWGL